MTAIADEAEACIARAEELRREREALLDRARDLRSERKTQPMTLARIAETTGISGRVLRDAAVSGALLAHRAGGSERGEIVATMAAIDAWLASQPARAVRLVSPTADAAQEAISAAARRFGGRR